MFSKTRAWWSPRRWPVWCAPHWPSSCEAPSSRSGYRLSRKASPCREMRSRRRSEAAPDSLSPPPPRPRHRLAHIPRRPHLVSVPSIPAFLAFAPDVAPCRDRPIAKRATEHRARYSTYAVPQQSILDTRRRLKFLPRQTARSTGLRRRSFHFCPPPLFTCMCGGMFFIKLCQLSAPSLLVEKARICTLTKHRPTQRRPAFDMTVLATHLWMGSPETAGIFTPIVPDILMRVEPKEKVEKG